MDIKYQGDKGEVTIWANTIYQIESGKIIITLFDDNGELPHKKRLTFGESRWAYHIATLVAIEDESLGHDSCLALGMSHYQHLASLYLAKKHDIDR